MNAKDLYQYANNTKTHKNSKYNKSVVRYFTSRKTQGKQFLSQKGFLLCRSCFWCASSLYLIDDRIKVSPFLQCPSCYNNRVELLPLYHSKYVVLQRGVMFNPEPSSKYHS